MKDKIKWPTGNRLDLCIPLRKITVTDEGTQFGEYVPSQAAVVMVYFVGNYASYEYTPRIEDNKLFITDNGELKPGVYAIDVRIQEPERKLRSFRCGELEIVRETKQLALGDFVLNNNVTLDADAFIFGEGPSAFEVAVRDGYTGTKAEWLESLRGKEGRGIADIVALPTGAFRILLTDGSAYITPILKGEQGVSIVDFTVSSITSQEVLCTITMSDGTTRTVNLPRGEKGEQGDAGEDGRGIQSVVMNNDYTITFSYTDGTSYTTPQALRGEKGENGKDGQDGRGISGMSLNDDNHLTVSYTDGTTYTTPQSLQGERGVGITDFEQVGESATMTFFNIYYSNGNISQIGLPKGEQGDRGETGPQGIKGDTVVLGEVGEYKLYNIGGTATDGAMTQDATTKAIAANTGYYECGTAAGTAAKVAVGDNEALYTLQKGGSIKVKMTNANAAASGVTLKIGSSAATPLYYNGNAVSASNTWEEGEVIEVYYDGSVYQATNAKVESGKAADMKYDNSASGLEAKNVQGALDELGQREIIFDGSNKINYYTDKLGFVIVSNEEIIWISNSKKQKHKAIPVNGEKYVKITAGENNAYIAFATSSYTTPTSSSHRELVPVCDGTGRYSVPANGFKIFTIPDDCAYILIDITNDNSTFYTPQSVYIGDNLGSLANNIPNKIPFATFEHLALRITNNQEYPIQSRNVTDYIDISGMLSIIYTRACPSGAGNDYGMLFYNENKEPISGYKELGSQAVSGYVIEKISVPDGAVYARFTYWNDEKWGNFFIANGDTDAVAIALWENTKNTRSLIGFEEGVYRQTEGTTDKGFLINPLYGLSTFIPVSKGDTVLWHYGNVEIRTMGLVVYDTEGNYITYYNNTTPNERLIENFMSTSSLSKFLIRASLLIANGSDNYVEVNGARVWTAFNESLGNKFNKIDKVMNPYTDVSFYNISINSASGYEAETTKRLSTSYIVHRGRYIISVAEGYQIRSINYYDKNKTWYKGTFAPARTVITEQQEVEGYIKLVITNEDDTTDIALDAPINLTFNTYSGGSLDEFDDALRIGTFNSSYNNTDVETVKLKFCALLDGKNNIENFLLFSDPHLSANSRYESMNEQIRDKYISTLQKYYNSLPLDNCICGGDLLNYHDSNAEALDELGYFDGYMRKLFRNYRPCFGNHDTAPYYDVSNPKMRNTTLVRTDIRNVLFREEKNTYYSFDGINTKFYVLNSGSSYIKPMSGNTNEPTINNIRWEQVDWFANKLLSDDASYSVILMHMYSNGTPLTWYEESMEKYSAGVFPFSKNIREVAIAYNNRTSITKNGITYDFSSCTGKVTVFLCGHSHFDFIDDSMELPVVCITNLEGGVWNAEEEKVEYALVPTFDCCMNDLDNSALYLTRVGAGVSRIVNYSHKAVSVGGSLSLTSKLNGTVTWQTRNSSIATVSNGTLAGVASGCTGIIATNENGEEEYWIVKVG